jgi:hypothetical protein
MCVVNTTPRPLYPGERARYTLESVWGKNLSPCQDSKRAGPAGRVVAIPTTLPWLPHIKKKCVKEILLFVTRPEISTEGLLNEPLLMNLPKIVSRLMYKCGLRRGMPYKI